MLPRDAVTAPRFSTGHHENSFDPNSVREETLGILASLTLDDGIEESVRHKLANRGHKIETVSQPIAYPVMIYVDQNTGMIYAAGDPETGRHAAALENTSP
jgi:gamma-glutamyltranspeptidase